ncbi:MAG: ComEC/Rec2 family competence protein [Candidatus Levyibacteriota bacterium]
MNRNLLLFCLALLATTGVRFLFFYQNREVYKDKQEINFHSIILSKPNFISNRQRLTANLPNGERVYVTTDTNANFNFGDNLAISGTLIRQLLTDKRSILTMNYPDIEVESNSLRFLSGLREKISSIFKKTLPPTSASLLLGIVFGIKEQMDKNFLDQLRNVGVLHVIAASGMNVVMVGGFLSSVFSFFLKRQLALVLTLFGIFFYAVLSGLEPSIIRASIMGGFVFISQILGRQSTASYALFLSAFVMLFLSPSLITDIGFQLSFTATAGLLYFRPLFERGKIKTVVKKSIIGEDVATTISAQAATLPILLANFGIYSLWSIAANALVLWTVPPLMVLGGLGAIFGLVLEPIGRIFIYLALPFLLYFEKLVSFFGEREGILEIANFPWQFAAAYWSILAALILYLRKK